MRRMLDMDIPGKKRQRAAKFACKRAMTEAGLKEDNATNRAELRKKLISYTGDPRQRDKPWICSAIITRVFSAHIIMRILQILQ